MQSQNGQNQPGGKQNGGGHAGEGTRGQRAQGLDRSAHRPLNEGEQYRPFVAAEESLLEHSLKALGRGI